MAENFPRAQPSLPIWTVRQSCPRRRRGDASGNEAAKRPGMRPAVEAKRQQALLSADAVFVELDGHRVDLQSLPCP